MSEIAARQAVELKAEPEKSEEISFKEFAQELKDHQASDFKEALFLLNEVEEVSGQSSRNLLWLSKVVGDGGLSVKELRPIVDALKHKVLGKPAKDEDRGRVELAGVILDAKQAAKPTDVYASYAQTLATHLDQGELDENSYFYQADDLAVAASEQGSNKAALEAIRKLSGRLRYNLYNFVIQGLATRGADASFLLKEMGKDLEQDKTSDRARGYGALAFARLHAERKILPVRDALLEIRGDDNELMESIGWAVADGKYQYSEGELEQHGDKFVTLVNTAESILEGNIKAGAYKEEGALATLGEREADSNRSLIMGAWLTLGKIKRAENVAGRITDKFWQGAAMENMAAYWAGRGDMKLAESYLQKMPEDRRMPISENSDIQLAYAEYLKKHTGEYKTVVANLLSLDKYDMDLDGKYHSYNMSRIISRGLIEHKDLANYLETAAEKCFDFKNKDADGTAWNLFMILRDAIEEKVAVPGIYEKLKALIDSGDVSFSQKADILTRLAILDYKD